MPAGEPFFVQTLALPWIAFATVSPAPLRLHPSLGDSAVVVSFPQLKGAQMRELPSDSRSQRKSFTTRAVAVAAVGRGEGIQ